MSRNAASTQALHSDRSRALVAAVATALLVIVVVGWGLLGRGAAHDALEARARYAAIASVAVVRPEAGPKSEEVVLPGQMTGLSETAILARTDGYVSSWKTDIGARVKAGQLLAVIESPEIDQQLRQAEADLRTAQANAAVARSTADRVAGLVATQSVSRQEGEDRTAAAMATAGQVASGQANVARLRQLKGFEHVVAPFSGVITARSTDVGALISAGGQGQVLFRIADSSKLRAFVDVPQSYAGVIHAGTAAVLHFADRPETVYPATVARTASAIDPQTRTMTVELDIDNPTGALFPGAFTEVHFDVPPRARSLQLPGGALLVRADGIRVASVAADDRVMLKPVTVGRDLGTTVEILTGVSASDRIILNPASAIESGDHVRVHLAPPQAKAAS